MKHRDDRARLIRKKYGQRRQRPHGCDDRDTRSFRKLRHLRTVADEMNYGPPPGYYPPSPYGGSPSGLAIASLVTGICALLCGIGSWVCCFLVFLAAPLAFVLAFVAIPTGAVGMAQIKKSGGALGGNGMAIAGLICGILALVPTLLWVIFVGWSMITS
jgi:hypothetical protein